VLEVLPAGSKKIWTRDLPAVVADAIPATNWDMRAFSYEADLGRQILGRTPCWWLVLKV